MTAAIDEDRQIRRRWSVTASAINLGLVMQDEDDEGDGQPEANSGQRKCGLPDCDELIAASKRKEKNNRRACCALHGRLLVKLDRDRRHAELLEDYDFLCDRRARVWEIPERLGFETPAQLSNWLAKRGRTQEAGVFERMTARDSVCWDDLPEFMRRYRGTSG